MAESVADDRLPDKFGGSTEPSRCRVPEHAAAERVCRVIDELVEVFGRLLVVALHQGSGFKFGHGKEMAWSTHVATDLFSGTALPFNDLGPEVFD